MKGAERGGVCLWTCVYGHAFLDGRTVEHKRGGEVARVRVYICQARIKTSRATSGEVARVRVYI